MPPNLMLHRGGWDATLADLASVPLPEPTDSYTPVPYPRLVEELKLHLPRFGLAVEDERYALAREGQQCFGVLTCRNGQPAAGWALAIGLRSSYDRSLAVDLVCGSRVFVCDNLAFHGEARVRRKHTVHVFRDLPDLMYRMLTDVAAMKSQLAVEIARMQTTTLTPERAHHLMVLAIRDGALAASKLPQVIAAFEDMHPESFGDRSAWSLFNACTALTGRQPPWRQMESTLRLTRVFRGALAES